MGGRPRIHAKIARADYEALRVLCKDDPEFPATYDLWFQRRAKELHDTVVSGDTVQEVEVNPEKFADWCRRSSLNPSFYAFNAFAVAKAKLGREP